MKKIQNEEIEISQMNLRMPKKLIDELKILAIRRHVSLSLYVQDILTMDVMNSKKHNQGGFDER